MKIVHISDSHSLHRFLQIPDADVIIATGDCSDEGRLDELQDFVRWLGELPIAHKIMIAGNHDYALQNAEESRFLGQLMSQSGISYLCDSTVTIKGVNFYGSPWLPAYRNMAFNIPRKSDALADKWKAIPDNTNVLLTHVPPYGILDTMTNGEHIGCELLAARLKTFHPCYHAFGHVHEAFGQVEIADTVFLNGAVRPRIGPLRTPHVFYIDK